MPKMPSTEEINATARRLGIADDDGKAHRRDRARIVETIWIAERETAREADDDRDDTPTARRIADFYRDLQAHHLPQSVAANLLPAVAAHLVRTDGLHITDREATPR